MKHGPAVFVSDSGRTFEGRFENDVMVGKMSQVSNSGYILFELDVAQN